jgi:polyhydroxyalkanoate synthesis regulator phasin
MGSTREALKKAFLIGVGATVVTAEKVKELVDELVERGELSQNEAKSFSEDLKTRALKEKEQFESRVKETVDTYVKKAMESLGVVSRQEFEALKAEVAGLKGESPEPASEAPVAEEQPA